jgi:hypothetical protein
MCGVVAVALAISASVFLCLSVGASLAFGLEELEANVLNNFSADELAPMVGHVWGDVVSWVIRGGYLVSVLGSLLLYMYPLRSCLAEVIWGSDDGTVVVRAQSLTGGLVTCQFAGKCLTGQCLTAALSAEEASMHSSSSVDAAMVVSMGSNGSWTDNANAVETGQMREAIPREGYTRQQQQQPRWQQLEQRWYFTLTYGLLLCMVLAAVLVPSIWSALSLIGDLACTTQAFMLPGAIALVLTIKHDGVATATGGAYVVLSGFVLLLGMALFANGVWQRV